jgi:NAD(P)H-hydrate epimerase
MKLFATSQIAGIDKYTIEHEPISDIDLMERAASTLVDWILQHAHPGQHMVFFVGPGNNGGDALAAARMLAWALPGIDVYVMDLGKRMSESGNTNLERLQQQDRTQIVYLDADTPIPEIKATDWVIDGLFGSGLSRPLNGLPSKIVKHINASGAMVVAIDIPSGLMGEDNRENDRDSIIRADVTLTFQFPKISFLLPENALFTGSWLVQDIGLHPDAIEKTKTPFFYTDHQVARKLLKDRRTFAHKGNFGHALLIAGSYGKMGAAVLASRGCLRSGVGLLTAHVPRLGYSILQNSIPEAMASIDQSDLMFTQHPDLAPFDVIGIGPGLDTKCNTGRGFQRMLEEGPKKPMVIDADGLNLLAKNPESLKMLPPETILTPHPGEFARLTHPVKCGYERLQLAMDYARENGVVLVLKGAHTAITCPDGTCWFNSTGNPGMATAGSGDVLTGILLGLLAQGYAAKDAAILGVYLHGMAADLAVKESSQEALLAGDITQHLGLAFATLKDS